MTIRVEHIMAAKKGGSIDCVEFALYMKTQFGGQCFKVNQQLAIVLDNNMRLSATIEKIKINDASVAIDNNNSNSVNKDVQYPSPTSDAERNFSNTGLAYLAVSTSIVIVPT